MNKLKLILLIYIFMLPTIAEQRITNTHEKNELALIDNLMSGGYVIFFLHGLTSATGEKVVPADQLDNCSIQRNLSTVGIQELKKMSIAIHKLAIPVGQVYTSPYCRCRDTANLLFNKSTISPSLYFAIHLDKSRRHQVTEQLRSMLASPPPQGKNTVLVSHTANLKEATGIWPKPKAAAYVFQPGKKGQFTYLGRIVPGSWIKASKS